MLEDQNLSMALTVHKASSSNSSTSNPIPKWKFHVFMSFRGEDTPKGFTDHLYAALCRKGIKAFRDDEELQRGEVISQKLLQAIEGSLFAIVVLSENYASSPWCLDELQKIITSRKEVGQQVFPIFSGVDPSDVRHQKGSFAQAFIKHAERFRVDKDKVQKWRDSLTEVANLSGWDFKDQPEAKLVEKVVEVLWSKLRSKFLPYDAKLVGIDSKIDVIDSLLGIGLDDIRFVGIWGMGGVGKTTLARVVYERLLDQFEICCFLSNVREAFERDDGSVYLQNKLLSHLKVKGMVIEDTYEGKKIIQNLFCNKKVLLVLDDVSAICHLEDLAESQEWFGLGSRVIITTRNMHLLISHGVRQIYKVDILNEEESLQLFSSKAFRRDTPKEGYLELSKSVVKYAQGLPLALRVLGSSFFESSVPKWEDALDKLKQVPNHDILKILQISFDGLDEEEKAIFLDIACFFNGWMKDEVIQILTNCGLHPIVGIKVLIEKSLLNEGMYLDMHDLIQEMGRSIVFQESPNDPGKRSRLCSPKDIHKVLKKKIGTEMIQRIVLTFNSHEAHWDREAFSKMINLRLLIITCNLNLPYGLKCLSSGLKVLRWNTYPLEDLPLGTELDELAYLQLHHSKIKQLWDGRQCLENLKYMDLSHSNCLFKTPNFVGVPNLERLILEDCIGLVEVHSSLGQLKNLLVVNLKGCKNLKFLPRKFEMDSLKEFVLFGCTQVKRLPEFGENMKSLETLDLQETGIVKLPDSLGFLTSMKIFNLKGCKNLVCLPHTFHNLKRLKILDISGCSKFSKLPENLNENKALEKFDASGTAITEVPSSIGQLKKLEKLSFHGCKGPTSNLSWIFPLPLSNIFQMDPFPKGIMLPPSFFNLTSLTELRLSYCNIDERIIPDDLGGLLFLELLDLSGNNFVNLPAACISNLLFLRYLYLDSCPRLQSLPHSSPTLLELKAYECASMQPLSDQQLSHLFASFYQRAPSALNAGLSVTISVSKIPSWFKNQNNITIDKHEEMGKHCGSIMIDVPPCEWLGYACCLVLQPEIKIFNVQIWDGDSGKDTKCFWYFTGHKHDKPVEHTLIMFCKTYTKSSWQCHRLFFLFKAFDFEDWPETCSIKCGWRFIDKEDLEEWGSTMGGCHSSMLEEEMDRLPILLDKCKTMPLKLPSLLLQDEGKLGESSA